MAEAGGDLQKREEKTEKDDVDEEDGDGNGGRRIRVLKLV